MLYVEGFSIDEFFKGNINLNPSKNNKIGVVFDKAIPKDVLNIHQFRRLFPVVVRPPKKIIVNWIENGTKEGKKAPAFTVDGQYFIETEKARDFVKSLGFEPVETVEK